jgi:hypothetical protein
MVAARPKTLLLSEAAIQADADAVKKLLAGASNVDAIVEAREWGGRRAARRRRGGAASQRLPD